MEDIDVTQHREAFSFVQALAIEVSEGRVELPSYPEAATRVQRALSSDDVDPAVVVSAVGSEPALALRVLKMANSALLNPMGRQVLDLKTAVSRIGYNMVRTASVSFVVEQLRQSEQLRELRPQLAELWHESVVLAALARVVAMRQTRVNPDVALLAGLLHGVGKLYILMRLQELPRLLVYPETCERILREWHGGVARAILDNWGVPDEVGEAVQEFESLDRDLLRTASLSEVLTAASLFALFRANLPDKSPTADDLSRLVSHNTRFWERLRIDAPQALDLLATAEAEIEALHAVLGH